MLQVQGNRIPNILQIFSSCYPIFGVSQDLYDHVLFNYKWLYAKSSALPLNELLSDFEDAVNNIEDAVAVKEINLVADSIRLGGAILKYYPEMLAAQVRM